MEFMENFLQKVNENYMNLRWSVGLVLEIMVRFVTKSQNELKDESKKVFDKTLTEKLVES